MAERVNILKIDTDKRQVFGWANVSIRKTGEVVIDSDEHAIPIDDLETAAYEFALSYRVGGEEHIKDLHTSRLIESCVFTKAKMAAMGLPDGAVPEGWWVGFQVEDDAAWLLVKSGKYSMFSIEGTAVKEPTE